MYPESTKYYIVLFSGEYSSMQILPEIYKAAFSRFKSFSERRTLCIL